MLTPACPARQFPNPLLEPVHRFRRDPPLWLPDSVKLNPRNFRSQGRATALFCWFTLSLSFARDESREALHHSFPGPPAANVDIAVVRIPRKPEPAPLQLPVELVEHDVRQQGRQRPALRRPFIHRTHQPAFHHSGLQKCPDQLQQPLVAHPFCDLRHQFVVVDPVEEFLQIQIHHPAIACGDVLLRLPPPPDAPSVQAETRSCDRKTSGPTCVAAPASPPAG